MADMWTKVQQGAKDAKTSAEAKLKEARESELWRKTSEQAAVAGNQIQKAANDTWTKAKDKEFWQRTADSAQQAGRNIQTAANETWGKAKEAVHGKRIQVCFVTPTLGLTLARQEATGRAVVARVDAAGPAAGYGVEAGMIISAIRAGSTDDGSNEPTITISSYEQLMGLFPAMGRPVTITFLTPPSGKTAGIVNETMQEEVVKAVNILDKLVSESKLNPDHNIPKTILREAKGIAIIRVARIGLGLSVKGGTGIVVARLGENLDEWSAPCAVGVGGVGWGLQMGVDLTDFVIILNTHEAVEAFATGNQVTLGGNVGVALGPVGRNGAVSASVHGGKLSQGEHYPVRVAPSYSYSHSQGAFIGVSLEGGIIHPRADVNERFYECPTTPRAILSGMVKPPASAMDLYASLYQAMGETPRFSPETHAASFNDTPAPSPVAEAVAATAVKNAEAEFEPLKPSSPSDDI